eukprot:jgi/Psemu1/29890/gm1.29890_g
MREIDNDYTASGIADNQTTTTTTTTIGTTAIEPQQIEQATNLWQQPQQQQQILENESNQRQQQGQKEANGNNNVAGKIPLGNNGKESSASNRNQEQSKQPGTITAKNNNVAGKIPLGNNGKESSASNRNQEQSKQPGTIEATGNHQSNREPSKQPGTIKATGNDQLSDKNGTWCNGIQNNNKAIASKSNQAKIKEETWEDITVIVNNPPNLQSITTVGEKKYSLAQAVSIDSFKTLDSTNKKFVVAFAESEPSLRIFAKASTQFAKQRLGTPKTIEITRTFAGQTVESKPKIGQGTKCDSVNSGYGIIGMRPNQLKSGNGVYVFKNNVDSTTKDNLEQKALHIVKETQLCLSPMPKFVNLETTVMNEVVSHTTLNAIGHHATAFFIGKDYHSKCHIDADMFYTRLTVIAPKHVSDDKVIYYFVFPSYRVKVPLHSGDTLLFNPLVLHSCSNPKFKGCCIMSAYKSRKTVLRANPL